MKLKSYYHQSRMELGRIILNMFKKLRKWLFVKLGGSPYHYDISVIRQIRKILIRKLGGIPRTETFGEIRTTAQVKLLSRKDLEDIIVNYAADSKKDWFAEYMLVEKLLEQANNTLKSVYHTDKELNKAKHVASLESKNKKLKQEVRQMQLKAEEFNKKLYATGLIVNCTGCIPGAPDHYDDLTEGKVKQVENIAIRLRTWWNNYQYRKEREKNKNGQ